MQFLILIKSNLSFEKLGAFRANSGDAVITFGDDDGVRGLLIALNGGINNHR